jgi:hypothetical protein
MMAEKRLNSAYISLLYSLLVSAVGTALTSKLSTNKQAVEQQESCVCKLCYSQAVFTTQ